MHDGFAKHRDDWKGWLCRTRGHEVESRERLCRDGAHLLGEN